MNRAGGPRSGAGAGRTIGRRTGRPTGRVRRTVRRLGQVIRVDVPDTLLRMLPRRTPTGLVAVGDPGPGAPVVLTGNFRLTVERVKRALAGLDAWLLIADSNGINVWCAATGGHFTDHDVVRALKTTGIARRVDHRRVILPQLAATGIDGATIREKTGWRVVWGPADAKDVPAYLAAGRRATDAMRAVAFPWTARLEMAVAWAFPISVVGGLLLFPFWRAGVLPVAGLVWGLALALFFAFPLYERFLDDARTEADAGGTGADGGAQANTTAEADGGVQADSTAGADRRAPARRHRGFVFFDFGERAVPLVLWAIFMVALVGATAVAGTLTAAVVLRWGIASLVVVLTLGLDLTGSTPTHKSGLHDDRLLAIRLDADACRAAGFCETVCPTRVFQVDHHAGVARLPRRDRCVQCGACIVQCPFDALYFETPAGDVVTPETVRRYRLNLLGKRTIHARGEGG